MDLMYPLVIKESCTLLILLLPLEEGVVTYKTTWEWRNAYVALGKTIAKYWEGYYLWKAILVKRDRAET